jgi:hypothetical protein
MKSPNLETLASSGSLKREAGGQKELDGLVHSGRMRLKDAGNTSLSIESRFDLAYNAAHALALAALRWHGYRSDNRYLVFQCLPHTLDVGPEVWRVLSHCHNLRNRGEYEGFLDVSETLIADLILAARKVQEQVASLTSRAGSS